MSKRAVLYRMVTSEHICPFGLKSKDLLERKGFDVEDHHLSSRSETDAFKEKHNGRYTPIIVIFSLAALIVLALMLKGGLPAGIEPFVMNFIGVTMVILALQKLQDIVAFSNQFITYDLLAMKHVRYAYVYPFAEAFAGLGMLAGLPAILVSPVSIFIGAIGAVSVIKAVYIDKRELKCACVGGNSDLPLGFISLTENLAMLGAGLYMLAKWIA